MSFDATEDPAVLDPAKEGDGAYDSRQSRCDLAGILGLVVVRVAGVLFSDPRRQFRAAG